jgi:tripartite-type tricarboxylate transporter receptor subunit TctC
MNAEIFRQAAKFDAVHVPYKGTPEAMTETAAGRIDFFFAPLSSALPLVKDGRLQALAVGTATRSPVLPNVPTTTEAGYAHSDYIFWVAMLAPASTPRAIVEKVNADVVKALNAPAVKEKLEFLGAEPMPMSPGDCDAFLKAEVARMAAVVKSAGIKAQ